MRQDSLRKKVLVKRLSVSEDVDHKFISKLASSKGKDRNLISYRILSFHKLKKIPTPFILKRSSLFSLRYERNILQGFSKKKKRYCKMNWMEFSTTLL